MEYTAVGMDWIWWEAQHTHPDWQTLVHGIRGKRHRHPGAGPDLGGRYIAICKLVLSRRLGMECGDPRPPALPLTDEQRSVVIDAIERLDLEPVARSL